MLNCGKPRFNVQLVTTTLERISLFEGEELFNKTRVVFIGTDIIRL